MNVSFGTDGIRGQVGQEPITPRAFNCLGQACAEWLKENHQPLTVAIGWDTRASGPALARAFAEGFAKNPQAKTVFLGITPTPAISFYVEHEPISLGVSITASHNPYTDNGLKLFKSTGSKLTRNEEAHIEALCASKVPYNSTFSPKNISGSDYYLEAFKKFLPQNSLKGRRIALDMAHGATTYTTLPLLQYLGADLILRGNAPDGKNINQDCGSEHVEAWTDFVRQQNAWLGFAHDGDGDRLVVIDETGTRVDGDQLLGLLALALDRQQRLKNRTLVVTEQSNSGLKTSLAQHHIQIHTCPIGDREVFYKLEAIQGNLGGENSGHIISKDEAPTGDGLRILLKVIELAQQQPIAERKQAIHLNPKYEASLSVSSKTPLEQLIHLQMSYQSIKNEPGRIYLRYSGTENKLRFLVEAETQALCEQRMSMLLAAARLDFQ